jgi:hypothetical protein
MDKEWINNFPIKEIRMSIRQETSKTNAYTFNPV